MMKRSTGALARRLGQRVREVRIAKGLSLDELARRSGIDPGDISRIETGKGPDSIGTDRIERLASALESDPGTLLEA